MFRGVYVYFRLLDGEIISLDRFGGDFGKMSWKCMAAKSLHMDFRSARWAFRRDTGNGRLSWLGRELNGLVVFWGGEEREEMGKGGFLVGWWWKYWLVWDLKWCTGHLIGQCRGRNGRSSVFWVCGLFGGIFAHFMGKIWQFFFC